MKKELCILFGFIFCLSLQSAPIVWDFTTSQATTTDGRFPLTMQGTSQIGSDGLVVTETLFDKPEGAVTKKMIYPELSPQAFRLTVDFKFSEKAFSRENRSFALYDNKLSFYNPTPSPTASHKGIFILLERGKNNAFTVKAHLGYGDKTGLYSSKAYKLEAGKAHTLVAEYDGAGIMKFEMDGVPSVHESTDTLPVAPATHTLVIGDRGTSLHKPFEGSIQKVALEALEPVKVRVIPKGRMAFVRDEEKAVATLRVWVWNPEKYAGAVVTTTSPSSEITSGQFPFATEPGTQEMLVTLPVNTSLRCGQYSCKLRLSGGQEEAYEYGFTLDICPKKYDNDQIRGMSEDKLFYDDIKTVGFTNLSINSWYGYYMQQQVPPETVTQPLYERLDQYLRDGLRGTAWCMQGSSFRKLYSKFPVEQKNGTKNVKILEASNPQLKEELVPGAMNYGSVVGRHPACNLVSTTSEVRYGSYPNFSALAREAYRRDTGKEIPPEVDDSRTGPHYNTLPHFPVSRVVPSNHPILEYYRWFWRDGDGWNPLQGYVAEAFCKGAGHSVRSFFAPAVRVPPLFGSGGPVTLNRQWTYVYPEPYNINYVISEQQNMAAGTKGQEGIITSIQCISYRSKLAPIGKEVPNPPAWVSDRPNTAYFTTPPDLVREALWTCFARRLDGIDGSPLRTLYDNAKMGQSKLGEGYQFTNGSTIEVIRNLYQRVAVPLGPLFRRVPERVPEVAVLESFAATIFAGRGTWGWHGKIYDYGTLATLANLNPKVLYEEDIEKGVPPETKVILMPECDVLTEESFAALREFDRRGGLIVGDANLVPGILADFQLPEFNRKNLAVDDDAAIRKAAQKLHNDLAGYYQPYSDSDKADIFTLVRSWKQADYLFVINDRRQAGDYVGQYGLVFEKGIPNQGNAILRRKAGAVYDLVEHKSVPYTCDGNKTTIPVQYETNDGRVFLVTEKPLSALAMRLPDSAKRGSRFQLAVTSPDKDVLIPVKIAIQGADDYVADESGYAVAEDGVFTREIHIPTNAPTGNWSFTVTNLADGSQITQKVVVK